MRYQSKLWNNNYLNVGAIRNLTAACKQRREICHNGGLHD